MNITEIKTGDIILIRKNIYYRFNGTYFYRRGGWLDPDSYDLDIRSKRNADFDIIAVYRPYPGIDLHVRPTQRALIKVVRHYSQRVDQGNYFMRISLL